MYKNTVKPLTVDFFSEHIRKLWPHPSNEFLLCHPIFLRQQELENWSQAAIEIAQQLSNLNSQSKGIDELNSSLKSLEPDCFSVDFAIVKDNDKLSIRLIEAQGFPSVMSAMLDLENIFYPLAKLGGKTIARRKHAMMRAITQNLPTKNLVMLDDKVTNQSSAIDFLSSVDFVSPRCISALYPFEDNWMHWGDSGAEKIKRIYHRSIYHTLNSDMKNALLKMLSHNDISHFNHPAWYYKIDKTSLTYLNHWSAPEIYDVSDSNTLNLDNMVLKFPNGYSGNEVFISPSKRMVSDAKKGSILQEYIKYHPFYPSTSTNNKLCVELRFMLINSSHGYIPITTLARATFDGNLMRFRKSKFKGEGYTVAVGVDE